MGFDLLVGNTSSLRFANDILENVGGLAGNEPFGKFAGEKTEQLFNDGVLFRHLKLILGGFLLALADFFTESLEGLTWFDLGSQFVVQRCGSAGVDRVECDGIRHFAVAEFFERKVFWRVQCERAFLGDFHSLDAFCKAGDQCSLVHQNPRVAASLDLCGGFGSDLGDRFAIHCALIGHNRIVAHGERAVCDRFKFRVWIAEVFQKPFDVLIGHGFLGDFDG